MGYELKLFIVEPTTPDMKNEVFCRLIGMIDISKPGHDSEIRKVNEKREGDEANKYYFYCCDGNHSLQKDQYGEKLRYRPLAEVLEAVEKDNKREPRYGRYRILLATLKEIQKSNFDNPLVAFFGY
jgi:hypothetical protein